jgi:hypothetical protein
MLYAYEIKIVHDYKVTGTICAIGNTGVWRFTLKVRFSAGKVSIYLDYLCGILTLSVFLAGYFTIFTITGICTLMFLFVFCNIYVNWKLEKFVTSTENY